MSFAVPIADGTVDTVDVGVGELVDDSGGVCTATLIAPHTAITAAHCTGAPPLTFVLDDGPYAVTASVTHPAFAPETLASDLAVLTLDHDAAVAPWSLAAFAPAAADAITLVGFGRDDAGAFGTRHAAGAVVTRIAGPRFQIDNSPACGGDSGAPAFVTTAGGAAVVGTVSSGQPLCGGTSDHVRTSAYLPWVLSIAPDARHTGVVAVDAPPTIAITRPGDGATMPDTFALGVHVGDDYGAISVAVAIDGSAGSSVAVIADDLSIPIALAPGHHALSVTVIDASSNTTTATLALEIEPPIHDPGTPGAACWDATDCETGSCDDHVCSGATMSGGGGCTTGNTAPSPLVVAMLWLLRIPWRRQT